MASALGIGLDVEAPNGNMVVDIGGGTTEIAVISLGGICESASIHVAGNEITTDIVDYLAQQYNISIGRTTAEQIKFAIGSVIPDLPPEDEPEDFHIIGRNMVTAHHPTRRSLPASTRPSPRSKVRLSRYCSGLSRSCIPTSSRTGFGLPVVALCSAVSPSDSPRK